MKLVEAHAAKLAKLCEDLDLESRSYTEYPHTVRCRLRQLHEIVVSSFGEVKVQCLPFPGQRCEGGGNSQLGCRGSESCARYGLAAE
jgi:hypothetical protein